MRHAAHPHQSAAKLKFRSIVRGVAALSLVLALTLAGCDLSLSGPTGLASYNCNNGCYTALDLSVTHQATTGVFDLPANFRGATSDILVAPLSCDAACGLAANYLSLFDPATGWYIRAGYETTPNGDVEYFMQYYLPDIPNNPNPTIYFAPTGINPGFAGNDPYVDFEIVSLDESAGPWIIAIFPDLTKPALYSYKTGPTFFQPTDLRYVQLIVGHSGAIAPLAVFTNNTYFPNILQTAFVKADGTPPGPGGTANQPSTGQWLNPTEQRQQWWGVRRAMLLAARVLPAAMPRN